MISSLTVGECDVSAQIIGDGLVEATLRTGHHVREAEVAINAVGLTEGSELILRWSVPNRDATAQWTARTEAERWLPVSFSQPWPVSAITSSPIGALYTPEDTNVLTFALSETVTPLTLTTGVSAATARYVVTARFDAASWQHEASYRVRLRLDFAPNPIAASLSTAVRWLEDASGGRAMQPPEFAAEAMYSTWYGLGQNIDAALIEREAALAVELGFATMIVDDGWQTADRFGGYSSCGDWEPNPDAFPDMAAHVGNVHALGLRYMLWFALSFVGAGSRAFDQLQHKTLGYRADLDTWVLDPRFPEVRQHLIERITRAVTEWGIDGVKLDFIDDFRLDAPNSRVGDASVEVAVDTLLADLTTALVQIRPDVMIEFRQTYVGPRLRRYANMVRVTDCAMDSTENRVHGLDLRLIAGSTLVHSDMVMWHPEAPDESAARQLMDVLFTVPQVSMRLEQITGSHRRVLANFLALGTQLRKTLLLSTLRPSRPDLSYPRVRADSDETTVFALYDGSFIDLVESPAPHLVLVNATSSAEIVVRSTLHALYTASVWDCRGAETARLDLTLSPSPIAIAIPPQGVAVLFERAFDTKREG